MFCNIILNIFDEIVGRFLSRQRKLISSAQCSAVEWETKKNHPSSKGHHHFVQFKSIIVSTSRRSMNLERMHLRGRQQQWPKEDDGLCLWCHFVLFFFRLTFSQPASKQRSIQELICECVIFGKKDGVVDVGILSKIFVFSRFILYI